MKKTAVLEGGGLRGTFSAGVLENLLERGYFLDHIIGVSAGACIAASYSSRQRGRNWRVNVQMPSSPRYVGLRNYLLTGSFFNMQYIFEEIPNNLDPFDEETFYASPEEFETGVTSRETGEMVYFNKEKLRKHGFCRVLMASSSIPFLSKPVEIDGTYYYDGGVGESIPVGHAVKSHEKVLVILTRPRGYRKKPVRFERLVRMKYRKHPAFADAMLNRWKQYNASLDLVNRLEGEGRAFVIAPEGEYIVKRMERDTERLGSLFRHGYASMDGRFEELVSFFG
ncbi:MAG: patatin-like phospholipase family protein [Spirochaetota bacterium]